MDRIITIGREYGSGGKHIAKLLSEKLELDLYGKELLTIAAKESGISEDFFEVYDEKPTKSYLFSLMAGFSGRAGMYDGYNNLPLNHKIFLAQFSAIKEIASKGPCIIVGRCADWVLSENPKLVKIFIQAPLNVRIDRIAETENISVDKAKDLVKKTDKQRSNYYEYYTSQKWGDRNNFDLCIDSSKTDLEKIADFIKYYVNEL